MQAFLLHRAAFSDKKEIWHWFTAERGHVASVCRLGKERAQVFQLHEIAFTSGSDLAQLQSWRAQGPILLEGQVWLDALQLNAILYRHCKRWVPQPELFASYWSGLRLVHAKQMNFAIFQAKLKFALLKALGFAINWQQDSNNRPIESNQYYQWSPTRHRFEINGHQITGFPGWWIIDIHRGQWDQQQLDWCNQLFEQQLAFISSE